MTTDEKILEIIQQIGGIFQRKNIPSVPINLEYLDETVAPDMENIVLIEMIMFLESLFTDYLEEEKKLHKYVRYVESFRTILEENSNDGALIGRVERSA